MSSTASLSSPHIPHTSIRVTSRQFVSPSPRVTCVATLPNSGRAKATRFALTIFLLTGLLAACSKHSELTLYVSTEVPRVEIERITAGVATPVEEIEAQDGTWRIRFREVISKDESIFIHKLLDQAVRATASAPPKLALQITEQDPEVQRIANVTPDAAPREFELEVERGERVLFAVETFTGSERVCTWSVPARDLPQLSYDVRLAGKTSGEEARQVLKQAHGNFQALAGKIAHQFSFVPPEATKSAAGVHIEPPRSVVFTFQRATDARWPDNVYPNFARVDQFASCMQTIVAASDDAFFGAFLFPQLSDKLVRFELGDTRF